MAYDITTYDPSGNDGDEALGDGYGRANFPPNYDNGQKIDAVGYGAPVAFATDILSDPTDMDDNDPTRGFDAPGTRVSRI